MPSDKTAPGIGTTAADVELAVTPPPAISPDVDLGAGQNPQGGTPLPVSTSKASAVVMTARRPWSIGQSIGLSRGYTFVPGEVTEVTVGDAAVLCGREWDGRTFKRAGQ